MKYMKFIKKTVSLLLCFALFAACAPVACADEGGVIDTAEIQAMVDSFVAERGIDPKDFSIGYVYTPTGEEFYYNPDTWYYPASVYKVPLMMQLAEKVYSGELTQDSVVDGLEVSKAEEYILTYSNNDFAHVIRRYLGGDEAWRQHAKTYTALEESYYHSDYMDYCYFTTRYTTEVMKTLYNESERFPNIIQCMMAAEPENYYKLGEELRAYDVAQKYGSFCDSFGDNFNHNTGIIYTPHPFILTVMTLNVSHYEQVIYDVAEMFTHYTLSLVEEQQAYEQEQLQAQAEAEEALRLAEEEKAAAEKAEAERLAAQQAEAERAEIEKQRQGRLVKLAVIALVFLFLALGAVLLLSKRAKRRRMEEYERRFRQEMQQRRNRR